MAIRIRWHEGYPVALCAARTEAEPDDLYLDDAIHEALADKFAFDWHSNGIVGSDFADRPARIVIAQLERGDNEDNQ